MTAKPRIESARNVAIPNTNRKLGRSSFARGRTRTNESTMPTSPAASTGGLVRSFMKCASRCGQLLDRHAPAERERRAGRVVRRVQRVAGHEPVRSGPDRPARPAPTRPRPAAGDAARRTAGKARKRRSAARPPAAAARRRRAARRPRSRAAASRPRAPPPTRSAPGTGRRCSRARRGTRSPGARAAAARRSSPTTSPKIAVREAEAADHERDEPGDADADDGAAAVLAERGQHGRQRDPQRVLGGRAVGVEARQLAVAAAPGPRPASRSSRRPSRPGR